MFVSVCLFCLFVPCVYIWETGDSELFCCFYLVLLFLSEITVIISPGSTKRLMRLSLLNMV